MGLIKEPVGVDFVVDPRPLTEAEERILVERILADKAKRARKSETFEVLFTDITPHLPQVTDTKKHARKRILLDELNLDAVPLTYGNKI